MKILAIETSCDETAAAIIEDGKTVISNVIASSQDLHAKTGGVIPENAAREQVRSMLPVLKSALNMPTYAEVNKYIGNQADAIAVTVGPGLIGSLIVGVETAKTLSYLTDLPIIPVNHLLGHVYANWLKKDILPEFPLLALVVSGGHTDLIYMQHEGKIKYIGGTRDDAAGEAFDKTARLLDLPYPGGPSISKLSQKFIDKNPEIKLNLFPRPMVNEKNFDFSFSGLKTSVSYYLAKNKNIDKEKIAAEIQEAIVDSLVEKSLKAIKKFCPRSFLLAGGVAANLRLRKKFQARIPLSQDSGKVPQTVLHIPELEFCTDNAAAIGAAAFYNNKKVTWQKISANPELTIIDLI
ncbi:tRNA (adenosine(37)-N6)-threonylcarbamoyltransferase complex transferase subunit TsaD [soil metagenome]